MQNKKENKEEVVICYDPSCYFVGREHIHVITNNGGYIKYITDKPRLKENNHADTR